MRVLPFDGRPYGAIRITPSPNSRLIARSRSRTLKLRPAAVAWLSASRKTVSALRFSIDAKTLPAGAPSGTKTPLRQVSLISSPRPA
jgi:hypothetical protein